MFHGFLSIISQPTPISLLQHRTSLKRSPGNQHRVKTPRPLSNAYRLHLPPIFSSLISSPNSKSTKVQPPNHPPINSSHTPSLTRPPVHPSPSTKTTNRTPDLDPYSDPTTIDDPNPKLSTPILLPHYIALPLTVLTLHGTCYILQWQNYSTTGGLFILLEAGTTFISLLSAGGLAIRRALSSMDISLLAGIQNRTLRENGVERHIQGLEDITDAKAFQDDKVHLGPIGRYPSSSSSTHSDLDPASDSDVNTLANHHGSNPSPLYTNSTCTSTRSKSTTPPAPPPSIISGQPNIAYTSNTNSDHITAITFSLETLTKRNVAWLHHTDAFDALSADLYTSHNKDTAIEHPTQNGHATAWQDADLEDRMKAWVEGVVEERPKGMGERTRHAYDEGLGAWGHEKDLDFEVKSELDEDKEGEKRERGVLRKNVPEGKMSSGKGRERNVLRKERKAV